MPVQRKVFRIEERMRAGARNPLHVGEPEPAPNHDEFMSELKALRALIGPQAKVSRETMERCRAQIAEAQSYKHELDLIYSAIKRTRQSIDHTGGSPLRGSHIARVGEELAAVVDDTEQATQTILKATEDIDQAANMLAAVLRTEHDQGLAGDIQERAVEIFQACNFQDLTGQRVAKVVATLKFIEDHVVRLMEIWHGLEQFKPVVLSELTGEQKFLNGPRLADEAGHSSQDDIDTLFGGA